MTKIADAVKRMEYVEDLWECAMSIAEMEGLIPASVQMVFAFETDHEDGTSSKVIVCRHVADEGAAAIAYPEARDELNFCGTILCTTCDATLPQHPDSQTVRNLTVAICSHCCHRAGWVKRVN
jgi:hypothetical protein